ncbi:MAG: hypothetical protein HYW48_08045 [Deltaproteobacteria bacterium]|nr:hypothetical protein [Deltaproteobacteria bacterium]
MKCLLYITLVLPLAFCAKGFDDPEVKVAEIQLADIDTEYSLFDVALDIKNIDDVRIDVTDGTAKLSLGAVQAKPVQFSGFALGPKKAQTVPVVVKIPTDEILALVDSKTINYSVVTEFHAKDKWDEQKTVTTEIKGDYELAGQVELLLQDPQKSWLKLRLRKD